MIVNDLIGFCIETNGKTVTLNTINGVKTVNINPNTVVMAPAEELAAFYARRLQEVVNSL